MSRKGLLGGGGAVMRRPCRSIVLDSGGTPLAWRAWAGWRNSVSTCLCSTRRQHFPIHMTEIAAVRFGWCPHDAGCDFASRLLGQQLTGSA